MATDQLLWRQKTYFRGVRPIALQVIASSRCSVTWGVLQKMASENYERRSKRKRERACGQTSQQAVKDAVYPLICQFWQFLSTLVRY